MECLSSSHVCMGFLPQYNNKHEWFVWSHDMNGYACYVRTKRSYYQYYYRNTEIQSSLILLKDMMSPKSTPCLLLCPSLGHSLRSSSLSPLLSCHASTNLSLCRRPSSFRFPSLRSEASQWKQPLNGYWCTNWEQHLQFYLSHRC